MPLSLCPFAASFKTISLKYDFKHILNDFIHVYSPRAGTDNPLGTKFWCQQKFLITLPICCQFKKNLLEVWFLPFLCVFFPNVYSPRQWQTTHWEQNIYDNRKAFSLCPYVASSKWSLRNLMLYIFFMILYMYIALGQGQKTPWGQTFDVNRKPLSLWPSVASFKQISLNSDFIHIS